MRLRQRFTSRFAWQLFASAALSLIALSASLGHSAYADRLGAVVQEAIDTNPELSAIRFNRQAIDQELRAARGLGLPSIDVSSNWGRQRDGRETALGIKESDPWRPRRDVSLIVSQRLFDGFEKAHEVERQKNRVESARWRVGDTANSIALRAVQAYLEVQRANAVLGAAERNVTALRSLRSRVLDRVNAGLGNSAEETEAGSRVAQARAVRVEARNRLADARALFVNVVGRAPGQLQPVAHPSHAMPKSVSAALREARIAAPSILATQFDSDAAREAIGTAYSRFYPQMNLEVSTFHGKNIEERGDRDLDARAMLVVRWNLFNGGINRARVREAAARASEAAEISANTQRVIERETRVSWNAMVAANARVPELREQLALARQTRATYSEQFDTGARRLLDLLDAQDEIFIAEASLFTEKSVGTFNAYRVLAAMGVLVEALKLAPPAEAVEPHHARPLDRLHDLRLWKAHVRRIKPTELLK